MDSEPGVDWMRAQQSPDGSPRLWMLRDGKPTAISVELGLDDGVYTEIVKSDLQPGDEVIVGEGARFR